MSEQIKSIRPRDHLIAAGKLYPNAWAMVDEFRNSRGRDLPEWPNWCYLPLSGFYAIVSSDARVDHLPLHLIPDVARLAAIGTWRVTQGVYRFDPAVYESIRETPLTGDLPCDALYRLPEWCIYIETPETTHAGFGRIYGAFVHLEWDANTQRHELRLLIDSDESLTPLVLHLGQWSITEALERFGREAASQMGSQHIKPTGGQIENLRTIVEPIISLTLYLCSEGADFGGERPQRPRPKKTKKGWRMFPPNKPRTWDVAVRLGAAMRRYRQQHETGQTVDHKGPRPHVRRAHWHSFWTGSKSDPEQRRIIVKWMPPIPVNIDDSELPTTIRPVK